MVTSDRRKWLALGLLAVVQFMVVLDIAIVNVALPSIKTDLGFSQSALAWVITAAPSPWTARAAISDVSDQASPAKSEASVKTTRPTRNNRRRPRRSAARPPRSRKPPKTNA